MPICIMPKTAGARNQTIPVRQSNNKTPHRFFQQSLHMYPASFEFVFIVTYAGRFNLCYKMF